MPRPLDISNEQVLPYYETSELKVRDLLRSLQKDLHDPDAKFLCMFLVDDFCGSGRTVLREVATAPLVGYLEPPIVDPRWHSKLRFDEESMELEMYYEGELALADPIRRAIESMGSSALYATAAASLDEVIRSRATRLKGALAKIDHSRLGEALDERASIYFCPLLTTQHAVDRLEALIPRLRGAFSRMSVMPSALLDSSRTITSTVTPMGELCEKYYNNEFGDQHTGSVKYGFDSCGLPLVLHHNTPNNSIYILWMRKGRFNPLFVRYERHGREGA